MSHHVIAAPTLIRAKQYAAGLGLPESDWTPITSPAFSRGLRADAYHVLPGVDEETATSVRTLAGKSKFTDHR